MPGSVCREKLSMAILSLREAAQAANVSRQTVYRYAKAGKLSTVVRDDNSKGVDTAELARVFGPLRSPETVTETRNKPETAGNSDSALQGELEATRLALKIAQESLTQAAERERRLLEILDRQTKLLEHQPPAEQKPPVEIGKKELKKAGPKKLRRWLRQMLGES